jgi:hypothetical protein
MKRKSRFLRNKTILRSNHTSSLKKSGTCTIEKKEFYPTFKYVLNQANMSLLERYAKQIEAEKNRKNFPIKE